MCLWNRQELDCTSRWRRLVSRPAVCLVIVCQVWCQLRRAFTQGSWHWFMSACLQDSLLAFSIDQRTFTLHSIRRVRSCVLYSVLLWSLCMFEKKTNSGIACISCETSGLVSATVCLWFIESVILLCYQLINLFIALHVSDCILWPLCIFLVGCSTVRKLSQPS